MSEFIVTLTCFVLGLCTLASSLTVISTLDMYEYYFKDYDTNFLISFIKSILNSFVQLYLVINGNKIAYYKQLIFAFSLQIITLILLPATTILIGGQTGFLITASILVISGVSDAIFLANVFSLCANLSMKHIIASSTGCAFCGIILNTIRYLIFFGYSDENESNLNISNIIFYSTSTFITLIGLILLILLYRNPWFIEMFYKQEETDSDDKMNNNEENQSKFEFTNVEISSTRSKNIKANTYTNALIENNHINKENLPDEVEEKNEEEEIILKNSINNKLSLFAYVIKKTIWMSSSMLITFITTGLIFPGLYIAMPIL